MIVDGHCDTLSLALDEGLLINNKKLMINIENIKKLKQSLLQMMAIYISPEKYVIEGTDKAWVRTLNILNKFYQQKRLFNEDIVQVLDKNSLNEIYNSNKIGTMLTIENGSCICGKIERIKELYNFGIKIMSLTWNNDNDLGCGAFTNNDIGLTKLGNKAVMELNKNNIIIDVSHSSEKTFWNICKLSSKPIVATHSCIHKICNNKRNLKDEQIKEIAKNNGIIGICYYSKFLKNKGKATIDDIISHIKYVANLVGIDYVGLGSDFDGINSDELPIGINGISDIEKISESLINSGFTIKETEKIMGENWLRIIKNIL